MDNKGIYFSFWVVLILYEYDIFLPCMDTLWFVSCDSLCLLSFWIFVYSCVFIFSHFLIAMVHFMLEWIKNLFWPIRSLGYISCIRYFSFCKDHVGSNLSSDYKIKYQIMYFPILLLESVWWNQYVRIYCRCLGDL